MILTVTLNAAIDKRYVVRDVQMNAVNRVEECKYSAGGKGLNVSRVAAIAGEEVTATGFVGGHAGNFIVDELEKWGIKNGFVHISGESRSCINIYNEANQMQTEFLEPGGYVTIENKDELLRRYMDLVEQSSVVAISGSVPKGVDSSMYKLLIRIAKEHNKKVILDTSGKLLEECIGEKPTMIKPNIDEIRMLTGKNVESIADVIEVAKEIQSRGIEIVVVSLGEKGSVIVCKEGIFQAVVPKIDAVNSVGCGDSMIAGFAIGLLKNIPMIDTIKLASAISAANALRIETGFFIKKDMEELLTKIEVITVG